MSGAALIDPPEPYLLLEIAGTIAFAVSGAAVAVRAGLDWLGVVVLAVGTAVGGGTVADLLRGSTPVTWIERPWPVWLAAVTALAVIGLAYRFPRRSPDTTPLVLVADAAGLAVFTVTGTTLALGDGVGAPVAALLGVVTGTGGGVIRDVLAGRRPLVLVGEIYALSAAAGATVLVLASRGEPPTRPTQWLSIAVILVLRLAAIRWSWSLPRPGPPREA